MISVSPATNIVDKFETTKANVVDKIQDLPILA